jgi:dTDP-4-dehydrorhamnose reductase
MILEKILHLKPNFVINCIGLTKPFIQNSNPNSVLKALQINSFFPQKLSLACETIDAKVIQITTDCIFSGRVGLYSEGSLPDPSDVYGMSKFLGEVQYQNTMNLRCSIVGPNIFGDNSLFSWVENLPKNSKVLGFTNHFWNGLTSFELSKAIERILINPIIFKQGTYHIVPANIVSKYSLIRIIINQLKREDLFVNEHEDKISTNRSLTTLYTDLNLLFWGANYQWQIPKIHEMDFGIKNF